jgi:hypothetical protein
MESDIRLLYGGNPDHSIHLDEVAPKGSMLTCCSVLAASHCSARLVRVDETGAAGPLA